MNNLLRFWKYINENYDEDLVEEAMEDNGVDASAIEKTTLSSLNAEALNSLFADIVNVYMDVSGTDNYGDVYEVLKNDIGMDDEDITVVLE